MGAGSLLVLEQGRRSYSGLKCFQFLRVLAGRLTQSLMRRENSLNKKKNLLDLTFIYQMTEGFLHNCDYVPKVGNIHPEVLFLCRYSNSVQMLLLISFKLQLTQSEGNLCAVSFHHHIAY